MSHTPTLTTDDRCRCGGEVFMDWWINYREKQRPEVFVRCHECGIPGPSAATEEVAIKLWRENGSAAAI
jgi:hypothetical protein